MKKQKTIKDIARALNLSASTVSRALRDHPKIKKETILRVKNLAEHWNYRPNEIALSLKNQRTRTIGVIIPEIVHFFFSTVISGIEKVAYEEGYTVLFCQSNESYDKEVLDTRALLAHRIDGLLVSHSRETKSFEHLQQVIASQIPVVFFDRDPRLDHSTSVIIDDFKAAERGTQHLIDQGCKRIAHLAGPTNLSIAKHRKQGYLSAISKFSTGDQKSLIIDCFDGSEERGYQAMKQLLFHTPRPDGIFANNDLIAVGAMKAIKEANLRIPKDIAVVGFSNWQFSNMIDPPLSTVAQPGIEMGQTAIRALIDLIEDKNEIQTRRQIILDTELIVRASSLRAPAHTADKSLVEN